MQRDTDKEISFKFKRNADIGTADAETDDKFLFDCFVDTGDLEVLRDSKNPRRIILGRTGAGKSALIRLLKEKEEHVIEIKPADLSLNYIANSNILMYLNEVGVKLDPFFGLLWKHVFAIELIKKRYHLTNEVTTKNWISNVLSNLQKKSHNKEKALNYLKEWGDKFWNETEYRIKEFTTKLEQDISGKVEIDILNSRVGGGGGVKVTEEEKQELIHKAQEVINSIQLKELSDVIRYLDEDVFEDPQNKYFIVIDGLDESWVDDSLRYKLIRALIETIRAFQKISNVKIIIALRVDLLQTVFDLTRDAGFQAEKYDSLMLKLRWTKRQLEELIDNRVSKLVKEQYTKRSVGYKEIFPEKIGSITFLDYLLSRTLYRPRDAIAFINECLKRAEEKNKVIVQTINEAEARYSNGRLEALEYEWKNRYPCFNKYVHLLDHKNAGFRVSTLQVSELENLITELVEIEGCEHDVVKKAALHYFQSSGSSINNFNIVLFKTLFIIGAVGIKPDSHIGDLWSHHDDLPPSEGQIKPNSVINVHPMLSRVLGIKYENQRHR